MLSLGKWMLRNPVSTSVTGTGWPSTLTVASVIPASEARGHARSSALVVPLPSKVLHSVVHAATKIFVRTGHQRVAAALSRIHEREGSQRRVDGRMGLVPRERLWRVEGLAGSSERRELRFVVEGDVSCQSQCSLRLDRDRGWRSQRLLACVVSPAT
jgi:hypothetical protein